MIVVIDDRLSFNFPALYLRRSMDALVVLDIIRASHYPLDEVWLDHDLGGVDTIRPVMLALETWQHEGDPLLVGRYVIHSYNPPGRDYLRATLGHMRVNYVEVSASPYLADVGA